MFGRPELASTFDGRKRRKPRQLSAISYVAHGGCRFSSPNRTVHAGGVYEDEISHVAFADPEMVRHLLVLLPGDVVAGLDTSRLRRLPTKQVGRGARQRVADMAWAVGAPTPERPDAEALLVIEFQSAPHVHMALRMEAYVVLLRQEMVAKLPAAAGLPPVLPVLVYTGDRPWRPPSLRQLTAPAPAGLRRWQPELEMLTLDAATPSAEDGEVNPAAALLHLQRCRRQEELPALAAALFGALRRNGLLALAERLSDALMQMLAARFGGETGVGHAEELQRALRYMEEPRMLAETVTQWRQEALDEGRRQGVSEGRRQGVSEGRRQGVSEGMSHERALLGRQAARRFGVAAGDALVALLANEEEAERLAQVGDLVVDCASAEELLRRGRGLLNGRS